MMPAAKALDPLLGIDVHIMQPPGPVPPVPLPNPYIGIVFDPMDFMPFLGATTRIGGLPRAQAGTSGQALPPHLPLGGMFVKPPSNESEIFMGSATVSVDGDAASYLALPVLSCVDIGMVPPPRLKPSDVKSLVLPMTKVLAIPGPVFIGGFPTISLTATANRLGLGNLVLLVQFIQSGCDPMILVGFVAGKLMGKLQDIANKALGKLTDKVFAKLKGKLKAKGKAKAPHGAHGTPDGNGAACATSCPIDSFTGEVYENYLDAKAPEGELFVWARRYSSALHRERSVCGVGFRHTYMAKLELFAQAYRFETFQRQVHFLTPVLDASDTSASDGYVVTREASDRIIIARRGEPTLHFALTPGEEPRLVLLSKGERRLVLEYDRGLLVALQEGIIDRGVARPSKRYLLQYLQNGLLGGVFRVEEAALGAAASGYTELARYEYDPHGRLLRSRNALGGIHTQRYDVEGRLVSQTDPRGYAFSWVYDAQGRCIESSGQDGLWWTKLSYAPLETHIRECTPGTFVHKFDAAGTLLEIHDPYGGVKRREVDPKSGRVVRETDAGGRVYEWLYDEAGYHYARRDAYGQLILPEAIHGAPGNPLAPRVPKTALEREFAIEADRRATFGPSPILLWDATTETAGALIPTGLPSPTSINLRADRRFNERGDLIEEIEPSGRRRTWDYDAAGNLVARRDADGRVFRREIVRWNLVGAKVDPLGNAVRYQFTDNERVSAITDPLGNVTSYEYDDKDRLVRVKRAGVIEDEYVYDSGDRIIEKRDAHGRILLGFEHDGRSLVKGVVLADGSEQLLAHDSFGRATVASTSEHEVLTRRDDAGRVISDRVDGLGVSVSHAGNSVTVFDRFELRRFGYGARISRSTRMDSAVCWDPTGKKHRVRIDPTGLIRRETPAGTVEFSRFDEVGQIDARVIERNNEHGQRLSWTRRYERSAEGDLLAIDDSQLGRTEYTIDAAHRVVGESSARGAHRYVLDAASNLLERPGLNGVVIGSHNALLQANGRRFEYDVRTHIAESFDPATGRATRYRYNARDLLTHVEIGHLEGVKWVNDEPVWTAAYDARGRRLSSGRAGDVRRYYYRDEQLTAELHESGRLRIYGYFEATAWVPLFFVDYESVEADPKAGRVHSVFGNHLGAPICVEDATGKVVWRAVRIDPYGEVELDPANQIELALRWPGHYFDADTGLHYNRYRYYDPKLGRYLQADPIGQRGGVNVYAYPANPLRDVDLLGLHSDEKAARSSGDESEGHPGKKGPDDAEGHPSKKSPDDDSEPRTTRDENGKLHGEDGRFVSDPDAGPSDITHKATKQAVEPPAKAKLDPNDPKVKAHVDGRNEAIKERKAAEARGDEQGAKDAQVKANKHTEQLGDRATDAHVKERYPQAERVHAGEGPGTHDAVYKNNDPPPNFIVAESKGGSATNSSSRQGPDGERYQQGTPEHYESTNAAMRKKQEAPLEPGAEKPKMTSREVADALTESDPKDIDRIEVRQPIDSQGNPSDMKVSRYGDSIPNPRAKNP